MILAIPLSVVSLLIVGLVWLAQTGIASAR